MKRWVRVVAVLAVILAVLAAVPIAWVWLAPGHFLRTAQGWSIDGAFGGPERVPSPSGDVAVWRAGSGGAPTYVLVHGFGDAAAGWTTVAIQLAEEHPVVLFDLPGHGRSDRPEQGYGIDDLVAGLDAVAATIDGPIVLVGNSLGGWVCTRWALDHGERVQELVLVNSAGWTQELDRDVLLPTTREGMRRKNVAIMGEHAPDMPGVMLDGLISLHADPQLREFFDRYPQMTPLDGQLARVQAPVRLIWGAPDPFFPVQGYLDRIQAERPEAELFVLEGCGHAPQYGCAEQVIDALLATPGSPSTVP